MSLWDPEAAGNAAQYLRLSEIALFEIRNAPSSELTLSGCQTLKLVT